MDGQVLEKELLNSVTGAAWWLASWLAGVTTRHDTAHQAPSHHSRVPRMRAHFFAHVPPRAHF